MKPTHLSLCIVALGLWACAVDDSGGDSIDGDGQQDAAGTSTGDGEGLTPDVSDSSTPDAGIIPDAGTTIDVGGTADTTVEPDVGEESFAGAALAPLSDGECPDLSRSGTATFSSGGVERTVVISLPGTARAGLPALTMWHGLGDSAQSMTQWMQMGTFAQNNEIVIVAPDSLARDTNTWDIFGGGGLDLVLYDDIRTCLSQELEVDLNRYYASGFSFGGLWTTFLTMNRADTLATTIPFSGGTVPFWNPYQTPAWEIPVLIVWGGQTDTYGSGAQSVDFDEAGQAFSESLRGDGHYVAHCDHGGGHSVPRDAGEFFGSWLLAHRYGQPSPYASGSLDGFPDYCYVP